MRMRDRAKWRWILAVLAGLGVAAPGCGGGDKRAEEPAPAIDEDGGDDEGGASDVLVPEEKFDEIKSVFERKASIVSRCFVTGVEAGEIEKNAKGHITIGATIGTDGKASSVKALQSSLGSKAAEQCVVDLVKDWTFTDSLPKPVETSHTYVMDQY